MPHPPPLAAAPPAPARIASALGLALLAAAPAAGARPPWLALALEAGAREDRLDWNIAGSLDGTGPNVLSELTWSRLRMVELRARAAARLRGPWLLALQGGYGRIRSGRNRDSDYLGDNRTLEYSRSENRGGGAVQDWSAALAWRRPLAGEGRPAYLTVLAGAARREQRLTITDGVQTVTDGTVPLGPIDGLDSRYRARWQGPWVGLRLDAPWGPAGFLSLAASYHWADFEGVGDWNLRQDWDHPVSFVHETTARGVEASLELERPLAGRWRGGLRASWRRWWGRPGLDTVRQRTATGISLLQTRLNQVRWSSLAAGVHLRLDF